MGAFFQFLQRMAASIHDPSYWAFAVPIPTRPESAALVLSAIVIFWTAIVIANWMRFSGHEMSVGAATDNIAILNLSDARIYFSSLFPADRTKSGNKRTVVILLKRKGKLARRIYCQLQLKQTADSGKIFLPKDAAQLDDGLADVAIRWPFWRFDLYTFRSLDPNVALQWKLGTLFLVLGILIPKMI
jgi:hypothetical protein